MKLRDWLDTALIVVALTAAAVGMASWYVPYPATNPTHCSCGQGACKCADCVNGGCAAKR
jgi:hypothetical protein